MLHLTDNFLQPTTNLKQNYASREERVRTEITKDEAIKLIRQKYSAQYDPLNLTFDAYDQLLACEAVAESTPLPAQEKPNDSKPNESANVSGSANGSCKYGVNFELTQSKLEAISWLKKCTTKHSDPPEIAKLLEAIFREFSAKQDHWLWVAQRWTPRAINRSMDFTLKAHAKGRIRKNPAAFFTYDLKHRKQRKS